MTFSIMTLCNCIECRYAECHYAECLDYLNVMLNFVMLNVVMLNVVMLSVVAPLFSHNSSPVPSMNKLQGSYSQLSLLFVTYQLAQ
jgi:hypothetical protein